MTKTMRRLLYVLFVAIALYALYLYGAKMVEERRKEIAQDKLAYEKSLVDVTREFYTNAQGEKFAKIRYSHGEVNIPEDYLSAFRVSPIHAVQFMAIYWPSRNPLKKPMNDGSQKKIKFFFLFDVSGGRFKNSVNALDAIRDSITKGRVKLVTDPIHPQIENYRKDNWMRGGLYLIDKGSVVDPLSRQVAYSCSELDDRCFFTWVLNESLFLRVEFNDGDVDNKIELMKELSSLIGRFIQE